MPNKPREGRRHRSVSFQNDQWEPGKQVAEEMGTSRNAVIEQLYQWWLGVPGVDLPERPPRDVFERAVAAWREQRDER